MKLLGLLATVSLLLLSAFGGGSAEQCGTQGGGALCQQGYCCSQYGWCGTTSDYCSGTNCQGQCWSSALTSLIPSDQFELMLKHRDDTGCPAHGFYTYNAFITAASFFPNFGATGDSATRKREIAAFLAQTSHETTGGWASAPDGPYAWGYCYKQELNPPQDYCSPSTQYPCATGKQYYGRGPIQLSWNYNYGPCGNAIGQDLLNNPDLVASDAVISFETALWFWMTPQSPKPSSHDVVTGNWSPTSADLAANRYPGYGVITNIINGGIECGQGLNASGEDRIGFYKRYCDILGVSYGDNLDCYNQTPFG